MSGIKKLEKAVLEMDIETSVNIIKQLVKKDGWKSVLSEIVDYLDRYHGPAWFGRNWYLLSLMDSVELVGIDYDIEEILKTVDDLHDFSEVQINAIEQLILKVREQLREGYPTYFYNLELMEVKRTVVLVEDLIEARQREFVRSVDIVRTGNYSHYDMYSYYGLAYCMEKDEEGYLDLNLEKADEILEQFVKETPLDNLRNSRHTEKSSRFAGGFPDLVFSGIADATYIVQIDDDFEGEKGWRGVPKGLLHRFANRSKYWLLKDSMIYLLKLNHPIVPSVLSKVLQFSELFCSS